MVDLAAARPARVTRLCLSFAALYGAALVAAGFLAPVYQSTSVSSSGEVTHGSGTLVGVNGPGVVAVLCVPLVVSVLVGLALWLGSRPRAVKLAWTLTGLLVVFNLLALMSIGLFVVPVTAALVVACVTGGAMPRTTTA